MNIKNEQYGFIYKWTNQVSGEYYIGQHKGTIDDGYIGSGVKFQPAYKSNPELWDREILDYANSWEDLNTLEAKYVDRDVLKEPLCMNQVTGGTSDYSAGPHAKNIVYWFHEEHGGFIGTHLDLMDRFSNQDLSRNNLTRVLADGGNKHCGGWVNLLTYRIKEDAKYNWSSANGSEFIGTAEALSNKCPELSIYVLNAMVKSKKTTQHKGWSIDR